LAVLLVGALAFLLLRDGDEQADDDTTTTEAEEEETTTTEGEQETTTTEDGDGEIQYQQIIDDTNTLVVEVPEAWTQVDGRPIAPQEGTEPLPNIQASTDLESFRRGFEAPGLSYSQLGFAPNPDETLDFFINTTRVAEVCQDAGRNDYDDGVFTGRIQRFDACAGNDSSAVLVVAAPDSQAFSVELSLVLTAADDPEIAQHILDTFNTV
jgi:hypothetical protein